MGERYEFRKLGGLTLILQILLGILIVLHLGGAGLSLKAHDMLEKGGFTEKQANALEEQSRSNALITLGVTFLTVVFFIKWIVRAQKNVRSFGATDLEISPGWAAGWFFVPFANLVKPFQAMRDMWKASRDPEDWRGVPTGWILSLWWGTWLLAGALGQAVFRLGRNAETRDQLLTLAQAEVASGLADALSALVALVLVTGVSRAQAATRRVMVEATEAEYEQQDDGEREDDRDEWARRMGQ